MLEARIAHGYDSVANLGTKDLSQRRRTLHNGNAMVNGQYSIPQNELKDTEYVLYLIVGPSLSRPFLFFL
jgi:hypothetical protein